MEHTYGYVAARYALLKFMGILQKKEDCGQELNETPLLLQYY
jgi:hypothetical protein